MHQAPASTPRFYRPREACAVLRIARATLYRRISEGDIKIIKFGGATLISQAEIERVTRPTALRT